jgi:hypothetical protein
MIQNTLPAERPHRVGREEAHAPDVAPSRRSAAGAVAAPVRATARAARARDAKPSAGREARTLPAAREAFVAAIARDTPGTDRPRLVKVLDALIGWSVARPAALAFRTDEKRGDVLAFELVGTGDVFWSATAVREASPSLEIHIPAGRPRSAEDRATVMETLNAHSRAVLVEGDRLRIGFGALKNEAARTAVLALMQQLLVNGRPSAGP